MRAPIAKTILWERVMSKGNILKIVIPSAKAAGFGTPQFVGRVKVFGKLLDDHATKEEKTRFKMAKIMFSAELLGPLHEQYQQWKSSPDGLTAAFATAESSQLANNFVSTLN